ncbi:MAG: YdhR family protein [Burkholderiaceae bacterium]
MISTIVQFKLPSPISRAKAQEVFMSTAPKYRESAGLIRKYYLLSEDGSTGGGVYLWQSREHAEAWFTPQWREHILRTYDAEPEVQYFETPVVVDNVTGNIEKD